MVRFMLTAMLAATISVTLPGNAAYPAAVGADQAAPSSPTPPTTPRAAPSAPQPAARPASGAVPAAGPSVPGIRNAPVDKSDDPATATSPSSGKPKEAPSRAPREKSPKEKSKERKGTSIQAARLPRYFVQLELTTDQQRQVQSMQSKYATRIDKLQQELDAVIALRDKELMSALNRNQQRRLKELQQAAKE